MKLGALSGCHQLPERSLFVRGYQLPLCARCTGALVGQCLSLATFPFFVPRLYVLIAFCVLMLLDWLIQYLNIKPSSNPRRVLSGLLCGYALETLNIGFLLFVISKALLLFGTQSEFVQTQLERCLEAMLG